jgi:hypothetical protein
MNYSIVETKIENKVNILATKGDIALLREDLLKFQIVVEKRFYNSILWVVGTGVGVIGLIISIIKLFIIK